IARRVAAGRLALPPPSFEVLGRAVATPTFSPEGLCIRRPWPGATFADLLGGEAPLYEAIRERFAEAIPAPRLGRLDTPESYARFRAERQAPYAADLAERLAVLEEAFS